jgi:Zn-dependent protease
MFKNFETSKTEIIDIIKAWIVISLAFAIVLTNNMITIKLLHNFLLAGLTVGVGFLFHELSHKILAQKYGAIAEFRAFDYMLIFALALSFFGFVFAAPGAVMIAGGNINIKKNGKISLAGPVTNLILAIIFLIISKLSFNDFLNTLGQYGFFINSWLALFNMIPFWNFDGKKVFMWNKLIWTIVVLIAVIFLWFI